MTEVNRFLQICLMSIDAIFGVKFSLSSLRLSKITFKDFVMSTHSHYLITFIAHQIFQRQTNTALRSALQHLASTVFTLIVIRQMPNHRSS